MSPDMFDLKTMQFAHTRRSGLMTWIRQVGDFGQGDGKYELNRKYQAGSVLAPYSEGTSFGWMQKKLIANWQFLNRHYRRF